MTIIDQLQTSLVSPEYTMSPERGYEVINEALENYATHIDSDATNVLIAPTYSELGNYVRSIESAYLPTIPDVMLGYEESSRFVIVMQDYDESNRTSPAHVFRVNSVNDNTIVDSTVGLPTFDDVLKMGLATEEELLAFYDVSDLRELGRSYLNVESNIAIEGVKASIRKPYSGLGYRALFQLCQHEAKRGVVAYQNPEAMRSLGHLGVISSPLLGNPDLSITNEDKLRIQTHNADADIDAEAARYFPLTVELSPWSRMESGVPLHNSSIFLDEKYAKDASRIAGLVTAKSLNVINIL